MKETVLFCIPLKKNCLSQYTDFAKETVVKAKEYRAMLSRYDIHSAKVWHKNIANQDYVFVYHDVGPSFRERMKNWDTSDHPFDKWFRESVGPELTRIRNNLEIESEKLSVLN